jgi:hypothetical protein
MRHARRRRKGQALAEFGPAGFIILVVIMYPMIDFLYMSVAYCYGWYCNHLVVRNVATVDPTNAAAVGTAVSNAVNAWGGSGMGATILGGLARTNPQNQIVFLLIDNASNAVTGNSGVPAPAPTTTTSVGYAQVTTQITVYPFLPIPWMGTCQGINAPITFNYQDQRPQEEKGYR